MVTNIEIIEAVEELMTLWAHQMTRVFSPWLEDKSAELTLAKAHYDKIRGEVME